MSDKHYFSFTDNSSRIRVAYTAEQSISDDDPGMIQAMGNQLYAEIGQRALIINFRQTTYMSSAFLGKLIRLDGKLKGASGKMILCGIRPEIYATFAQTKLNTVFAIKETVADAIGEAHRLGFG